MKRVLSILFFGLAALLSLPVMAADRVVNGRVFDDSGEGAIAASVQIPGTAIGTVTDLEGGFTLSVPEGTQQLQVSYVGYQTEVITLDKRTEYVVHLQPDVIALDETVVVGYGTAKRSSVSGSLSRVKADDLEDRVGVSNDITQVLQGALAGVQVIGADGAPGSSMQIVVRGSASINADATPLYVVDGVPVEDLSGLNPSDVERIDVLKDASSSAIYGSRGANGVVLISTKTATKGEKLKVQLTTNWGLQQVERTVDVMTAEEWIAYRTRYNNAQYMAKYGALGAQVTDDYTTRLQYTGKHNNKSMNDPRWANGGKGLDVYDLEGNVLPQFQKDLMYIDWQEEMFRLAPMHNYQLSVSGNSENTTYRISAGYVGQEGIIINTGYRKLTARANIETRFLKHLIFSLNVAPTYSHYQGSNSTSGSSGQTNAALQRVPVVEAEAGVNSGAEPYDHYEWATTGISPVAYMNQVKYGKDDFGSNNSAGLTFDFSPWVEGLTLEGLGAFNFGFTTYNRFIPSSVTKYWTSGEGYYSTATSSKTYRMSWLAQVLLRYHHEFEGGHELQALAGYSAEQNSSGYTNASATHFPDNSIWNSFNMKDETLSDFSTGVGTKTRLLSGFARVQYNYNNRYMLTASLRADGSSRLGKNNRWGWFPAVSAAWNIAEEKFWPSHRVVNQMKIRGSWGMNGNQRIAATASMAILGSANYSQDGTLLNGFAPISLENADLGWEKTSSWDVGFDLAFLNNRIVLGVDYYDKLTTSLLYQVSIPGASGMSKIWDNVGNIRNRGVEIELNATPVDTKLFRWTTSFNAAYNNNKIESLGDDNTTLYGYWNNMIIYGNAVGQTLTSYYMYDAVGVYQTAEDLKRYASMSDSKVGDVRYRDVNGDGVINDDDRTYLGHAHPDWTFGWRNQFKIWNFDLSVLFTAQTGGMIYSTLGNVIDKPANVSYNMLSKWSNCWVSEEDPGDGHTPSIDSQATYLDSRWLYSTDFFKIKNITLGYKFKLPKQCPLRGCRLTLAVENVYVVDRYTGGFSAEATQGAVDGGSYPHPRTFTLGAQFTF